MVFLKGSAGTNQNKRSRALRVFGGHGSKLSLVNSNYAIDMVINLIRESAAYSIRPNEIMERDYDFHFIWITLPRPVAATAWLVTRFIDDYQSPIGCSKHWSVTSGPQRLSPLDYLSGQICLVNYGGRCHTATVVTNWRCRELWSLVFNSVCAHTRFARV